MDAATIISILCVVLPFANETAIVLTKSGLPLFHGLYSSCFDETILGDISVTRELKKKICRKKDYRNKIIIDLIAYLGIILFIGKNTLLYGYVTGVATGMVLIFCSIMLPNLFLGAAIHKITKFLNIHNPYVFIFVGISLIIGLIILTKILEAETQALTKSIKIDPIAEKHTESYGGGYGYQ
jgi:hypothetical protein